VLIRTILPLVALSGGRGATLAGEQDGEDCPLTGPVAVGPHCSPVELHQALHQPQAETEPALAALSFSSARPYG
jgi:hypothetical protein